jgi:hypothetical protein
MKTLVKSKDGRRSINPSTYTLEQFCARSGYTPEEAQALGVTFRDSVPVYGPTAESRRMTEQLRWERVTSIDRESRDRAVGTEWKH